MSKNTPPFNFFTFKWYTISNRFVKKMVKLNSPLFSRVAQGSLGHILSFRRSRKVNIVENKPIPEDAKSLLQLSWRHMYQKAVVLWHALNAAEKQDWESQARRRHMTGFAWFMSQALKPNPGLYLPLQGGTMQGDIDMAKFRLLKLPLPTDAQEAASKAYHDANMYSDAEADARIALHAAIAAAHHIRYADAEAQIVADARIAIHAALATVHQDAPALILAHKGDASAHHTKYSDAEALAAAIAGGALAEIGDTILGAPAASVSFAAIPAGYASFLLIWHDVYGDSTQLQKLRLTYNNDNGNNYDFSRKQFGQASATTNAAAYVELGNCGDTDSAQRRSHGYVHILNRANNVKPSIGVHTEDHRAGGSAQDISGGHLEGKWRNVVNEISTITITASVGNFVAGSRFILLGVKT